MRALDPVLDAMAEAVNAAIALDVEAPGRLQRLSERPLAVEVRGIGITVFAQVDHDRLHLSTDAETPAVVRIAGPPASLAMLATRSGTGVLFSGSLHVTGDVVAAREWKRLFDRLDPDWEEALAQVVGDIPAHESARVAQAVRAWLRRAAKGRAADLRAWLIDEVAGVPAPREVDAWMEGVDDLRADADRLVARIARLERRMGGGDE